MCLLNFTFMVRLDCFYSALQVWTGRGPVPAGSHQGGAVRDAGGPAAGQVSAQGVGQAAQGDGEEAAQDQPEQVGTAEDLAAWNRSLPSLKSGRKKNHFLLR